VRALVFHSIRTVGVETVPDPVLREPGDALVRVLRTAICGSDLHPYHGREVGLDAGTVMGHEFLGEVVDTGPAARAWRRGDRVVAPFSTACGTCTACAGGLSARCVHGQLFGWVAGGAGLNGAQAEYVRVPLADATLVRVPEGVGLEAALLVGDVLATGLYAARRAELGPRSTCAIVGCGPIGLAALLAVRSIGVERVFALDTVPERLALAARFGAVALDARDPNPGGAVRDTTGGHGVDAALEAAGTAAATRLAWDVVRPGGTLALAGVHTEQAFGITPTEAYDKNVTIRSGRCPARSLMPQLIDWLPAHARDVEALVTHRLPLADATSAYRLFDTKQDGCIKIVLDPTRS
jgi:threonine dehydrogenase-like Zn-dependent dehydrogenase